MWLLKGSKRDPCDDGNAQCLYPDCDTCVRSYHWGKWDKGHMDSTCFISCNCMWTYNYLKKKKVQLKNIKTCLMKVIKFDLTIKIYIYDIRTSLHWKNSSISLWAEILKCNSIGELDSISFYFIHSSCINHWLIINKPFNLMAIMTSVSDVV